MKRFLLTILISMSVGGWAKTAATDAAPTATPRSDASLQVTEHIVKGVNVGGIYTNEEDEAVDPGPIRPLSNLDHNWSERQSQILKESVLW